MVDVYYYVTGDEAKESLECGIKLSEKFDKEVLIDNKKQKCFIGYLNPKNNLELYNSERHICFKASVNNNYIYIGESKLYEMGELNNEAMVGYNKMIIPINDYIFGSYRNPECIITTTLLSDSLEILNKNIGAPMLIEESEDLYIEKLILGFRDENEDFQNDMLYTYFAWLVSQEKAYVIHTKNTKTDAFIINDTEKYIILKRPTID